MIGQSRWPGHGEDFLCDWNGRDLVPVNITDEVEVAAAVGCPHAMAVMARKVASVTAAAAENASAAATVVATTTSSFSASSSNSQDGDAAKFDTKFDDDDAYEHCYVLNAFSDFRLKWTMRPRDNMVDIQVN